MDYAVSIERRALKALAKIPPPHRGRVATAIDGLASIPYPPGTKKLVGRDAWRIRVGDYRVIYEIDEMHLVILVVALGHRQGVYGI
ncbi:MAG: type II toxin-antitoxin system RelE family toxin [Gammaproteobacteria bacterium]